MNEKNKSTPESNSNKWKEINEVQQPIEAEKEEKIKEIADQEQSRESFQEEINSSKRCEELETQLANIKGELQAYKEQVVRIQADMDNLRKRTERDKDNAIKYGIERLLIDLIPVVDSLVSGLELKDLELEKNSQAKSLYEGMSLTLTLLHKTLEKHGVQILDPKQGDNFNPEIHEAMSIQKSADIEPGVIVHIMQKGYSLNGRVLRAARVIVSES